MDYKKLIKAKKYDFLRENEHLKDRVILLGMGGSISYGTSNENSDIDIRGVSLNRPEELLGLSQHEQFIDEDTDTVVYSFNKMVNLLMACNPNTVEILGLKPDHYLYITDIGQSLLDNTKMFLSRRAIQSFGGYADAQLRRLQNALARGYLPQSEKEKHMLNSVKNAMTYFKERYESFDNGSLKIYVDKSVNPDLDEEIFIDANLTHYPLRDYHSIWNDMHAVVKSYDNLNKRNKKKDYAHLNKHAMHLLRLFMMALDILENEKVVTYREKEQELLLSIRNGAYQKEDGTYCPEFFEMVDEYEKRLNYAAENTSLPAVPDFKKIEEYVIEVNRKGLELC